MSVYAGQWVVGVLSLSFAGACSSGSGGTGSGVPADCRAACEHVAAANCPQQNPLDQCITECEAEREEPSCASQSNAFIGCVTTATVTCDADGTSNIAGCDAQIQAYAACFACVVQSTDTSCDTCSKSNCCSERKALYGHPDLFELADCFNACSADPTCSQSCQQQFPSATRASLDFSQCEQAACPSC